MADIIQAQIIDEEIVMPSADPVAHNMPGGGAVESVNGKTGAVMLTAEDVGAVAAETFNTAMQGKQDKLTAGAGAEIKDGVLSATTLGITGAAVGQIARITAVDSGGKPTAWEPVDLPSDKWELIATGTITEDVTFFDISEDMNGEPFKLSRAYICAAITPPATPTNSYVTARYNEKTVCNSIGSGGPPTNIRYYQAIGEITGRTVTVAHSVSYNTYNNTLNIYNHSPYYWKNTWKDQDYIYSVGISAGNGVSNQIGANTTYEIYGVRA